MNYVIDYINENEFKKLERALKKYNMQAYKKLLFDHYPNLKEGNFVGNVIFRDKNITRYELKLPAENHFRHVHGDVNLIYVVYEKEKVVMLEEITPKDFWLESTEMKDEIKSYKGVMLSKSHKELDMFKINLLNTLKNDK
jgi:hypothetical protein